MDSALSPFVTYFFTRLPWRLHISVLTNSFGAHQPWIPPQEKLWFPVGPDSSGG